jgi:hypothetical protein
LIVLFESAQVPPDTEASKAIAEIDESITSSSNDVPFFIPTQGRKQSQRFQPTSSAERYTSFQCILRENFQTDPDLPVDRQDKQMKGRWIQLILIGRPVEPGSLTEGHRSSFREISSDEYEYHCTDCRGTLAHEMRICPHCGADTTQFIKEVENSLEESDANTLGLDELEDRISLSASKLGANSMD